jgi:hypothetical protein
MIPSIEEQRNNDDGEFSVQNIILYQIYLKKKLTKKTGILNMWLF